MSPGRNDRCPCGSGRKYKHCCLREEAAKRAAVPDLGIRAALQWLSRRFDDQIEEILEFDFFGEHSQDDVVEAIAELPQGMDEMLSINIGDFMLSEAIYERDDKECRGIDWVLAKGGPRLTSSQRAFMEALSIAPLRLYEVVSVRPGEGVELRDAVNPDRSPPFVTEHTASHTLRVGNMLGARVVREADGCTLSGALFPLARMAALEVMDRVDRMFDPEELLDEDGSNTDDLDDTDAIDDVADDADDDEDAQAKRAEIARIVEEIDLDLTPEEMEDAEAVADEMEDEWLTEEIRHAWLESLLPRPLPQLVDRVGGAPLMLIEDDYDVGDPAALAAVLAAQADVIGDADDGWSRMEKPQRGRELSSVLSSINPGDTPRLVTLFHRTETAARTGVEWFERVAGGHVTHRVRRVTDPHDVLRESNTVVPMSRGKPNPVSDLSPDVPEQLYEQVMRHTYAKWCDEAIPVLGGKTPRECMASFDDRERVRYLLRSYEHGEAEQAEIQGRSAVSFDFLWEALALAREEPSRGPGDARNAD